MRTAGHGLSGTIDYKTLWEGHDLKHCMKWLVSARLPALASLYSFCSACLFTYPQPLCNRYPHHQYPLCTLFSRPLCNPDSQSRCLLVSLPLCTLFSQPLCTLCSQPLIVLNIICDSAGRRSRTHRSAKSSSITSLNFAGSSMILGSSRALAERIGSRPRSQVYMCVCPCVISCVCPRVISVRLSSCLPL